MKYLLDTNICIYIIRQKPSHARQRFREHNTDEIGVSTITAAELQYGVHKGQSVTRNMVALEQFLAPLTIADFDEDAAASYGKVRAHLEPKGLPIGPLDTLIAGHALSLDVILVTNNMKEFARVPNLKLDNWI